MWFLFVCLIVCLFVCLSVCLSLSISLSLSLSLSLYPLELRLCFSRSLSPSHSLSLSLSFSIPLSLSPRLLFLQVFFSHFPFFSFRFPVFPPARHRLSPCSTSFAGWRPGWGCAFVSIELAKKGAKWQISCCKYLYRNMIKQQQHEHDFGVHWAGCHLLL